MITTQSLQTIHVNIGDLYMKKKTDCQPENILNSDFFQPKIHLLSNILQAYRFAQASTDVADQES